MFNFKKYPELIPYHKKRKKMSNKLSHLVNLSVDKDNESAGIKADKRYEEIREFEKEYEEWDEVIGVIATGDNIYRCLICATEEDGGRYRFPPEYYDPDLTDKTL